MGYEQLGIGLLPDLPEASRPTRSRRRRRAARDRAISDHPQTQVKLAAYGSYLPEWLEVMSSVDTDVYILDLFAGPGRYHATDGGVAPGSPLIACDAALYVGERSRARGRDLRVHLRFVERSRKTISILRESVAPHAGRLDVRVEQGTAAEWAPEFAKESRGHPTLVLFDPDGYKDVPFRLVELFAGRKYTEVLVSFDVQGYVRAAGLVEAGSLTEFCGDDMWRQDRRPDGTIDVDRFLEGYRRRLGRKGMFPRATIKRIVFTEAHANRAIAQACGSERAVALWRSCFVAAYERSGAQVLEIVHQVDRRQRIDAALETIVELSGSTGVLYGLIRHVLESHELSESDTHQVLLYLRDLGHVTWTSRLHRDARPAPRFHFAEVPAGLTWDGTERIRERPPLRVAPSSR